MLRTTRIMANRTSHCALGPAPKTIGMGPMKIIPPKLVESSCENIVATAASSRPTMVVENPRMRRARSFRGVLGSSSADLVFSRVCIVASSAYLDRTCSIKISIIRSAVRVIESSRTVFRDSLSVPKTIGIGPIIIASPPLILPVLMFFDRRTSAVAIMIITIPTKTSVVPRL